MNEPIHSDLKPGPSFQAVCLGCGCVCDDVGLSISGAELNSFEPRCVLGHAWFEGGLRQLHGFDAASAENVATQLANALREARSPVLYGLTQCSTETVRSALELADRVGARLILNRKDSEVQRASAFQNVGRVTATLGEVKNRSDLVIYWGCDPASTHPRHGGRYSSDAVGRFLPGGRGDRTVVVIGSSPNESTASADEYISPDPDRTLEFVTFARLLIRGKPVPDASAFQALGLTRTALEGFVQRCRRARYGSLFFQPPPGSGTHGRLVWEAVVSLVRDLNEVTRFAIVSLGSTGNLAGAEAALSWQTGQLLGVDYRLGFPEPLRGDASLNDCLESGDLDLLLVIADELPGNLSALAREKLSRTPCFAVGPRSRWDANVAYRGAIATARFGIDSGGTVTRCDGVVLPVRPVVDSGLRSEADWIQTVLRMVEGENKENEPPMVADERR